MFLSHASGPDDAQLARYLLGLLSSEETERVDELTFVDDDVAWRVRDVENDLVDAYVRGTLDGEMLARFESFYLSSPRRRQKVKFAAGFVRAADAAAVPELLDLVPEPAPTPVERPVRSSAPRPRWYERLLPHSRPAWSLAATAMALLLASGALLSQDLLVRRQNFLHAQSAKAVLDRRAQELERQLREQRLAHAGTTKELDSVRESLADLEQRAPSPESLTDTSAPPSPALATVALVLWPQTRAAASLPSVSLPPGTARLALSLRIDSNDLLGYRAVLKDPATDRVIWRSGTLAPKSAGGQAVSVLIPASRLKPQHYSVELTARGDTADAEVVGSYIFRIVQR
jgi:anti-sigma factor RsiW